LKHTTVGYIWDFLGTAGVLLEPLYSSSEGLQEKHVEIPNRLCLVITSHVEGGCHAVMIVDVIRIIENENKLIPRD